MRQKDTRIRERMKELKQRHKRGKQGTQKNESERGKYDRGNESVKETEIRKKKGNVRVGKKGYEMRQTHQKERGGK